MIDDGSLTPGSPVGIEAARTIGSTLNKCSPAEFAEMFKITPNFNWHENRQSDALIAQIDQFARLFPNDVNFETPGWINFDRFILATSGFSANPRFWEYVLSLSERHRRYLHNKLAIPSGEEEHYLLAHSPEAIASNNASFFGRTIITTAMAALFGNTMETIPISEFGKENAILNAILDISKTFGGIATSPEEFVNRIIVAFRDLIYNALIAHDAFRVRTILPVSTTESGETTYRRVHRLCPFAGNASSHLLQGIALAFGDEDFVKEYLRYITKS